MRQTPKSPGEKIVKDIKRATRRHYSSEEKIRIVLDGRYHITNSQLIDYFSEIAECAEVLPVGFRHVKYTKNWKNYEECACVVCGLPEFSCESGPVGYQTERTAGLRPVV